MRARRAIVIASFAAMIVGAGLYLLARLTSVTPEVDPCDSPNLTIDPCDVRSREDKRTSLRNWERKRE